MEFPILEIGFLHRRFDALQGWLQRIGYKEPFLVACNDATAVLPRVRWRSVDDAIFGAAIPDNELPSVDLRAGSSLEVLLARLEKYGLATQAEVMLVGPAHPAAPRFVLGVFAQKSGGTADCSCQRWRIIEEELRKRHLYVICSGSDAGGSNVAAQQQYSEV